MNDALRPQGSILKITAARGAPVGDVFEAARAAGRQLVQEGQMSSQLLAIVSRPLMPLDAYVPAMNQGFQQVLSALRLFMKAEAR